MSLPVSLVALLTPVLALIAATPDPILLHLGPLPVYWYGLCYAVGIAAAYLVVTREARRRGLPARLVDNGIIVVALAALVGGRLYHVIDQWARYRDDVILAILPLTRLPDGSLQFAGFTGLGVYGGIITGTIAAWYLTRRWHQSFWKWADVIAPGVFAMQAIGRWGNFFNQELYGPPTTLPWGIAIDCAHRVADYPCSAFPLETTGFHPLFLYESLSGALGAITLLWLARRYGQRMRPGDLLLVFFIWYAVVRFALETLRSGNWVFFGIPTAMVVSIVMIAGALLVLVIRHRSGAGDGDRWGEPPEPGWDAPDDDDDWVDDDEAEAGEPDDEQEADLATAGDDPTAGEAVGDEEPDGAHELEHGAAHPG